MGCRIATFALWGCSSLSSEDRHRFYIPMSCVTGAEENCSEERPEQPADSMVVAPLHAWSIHPSEQLAAHLHPWCAERQPCCSTQSSNAHPALVDSLNHFPGHQVLELESLFCNQGHSQFRPNKFHLTMGGKVKAMGKDLK